MVDIEPIIEYDYSKFGIQNFLDIFIFLYMAFIYPIFTILNYDIKGNKQTMQDVYAVQNAPCIKFQKEGL